MAQESEHSTTAASGNVINQHPTSGTFVGEGFPVNLLISSGPLTVPNLTGQTSVGYVVRGSAEARQRFAAIIKRETFGQGATCDFDWDIVGTVVPIAPRGQVTTIQFDAGAKTGLRDGNATQPDRQPAVYYKAFVCRNPRIENRQRCSGT